MSSCIDDSFWNPPSYEMYGYTMLYLDLHLSREISRSVESQLKRNADAQLKLIRGEALSKLTSKPEIVLRGRWWPIQRTIEF